MERILFGDETLLTFGHDDEAEEEGAANHCTAQKGLKEDGGLEVQALVQTHRDLREEKVSRQNKLFLSLVCFFRSP